MVDLGNMYYEVTVIPDKSREAICQVPNHGDDHQREDTSSEGFILIIGDHRRIWKLQKKMMEYSDFVTRISFDFLGARSETF